MKPWAHGGAADEMEYVRVGMEIFIRHLQDAGAPAKQIERFKENFTGKNRKFDALEAAFFAHYNFSASGEHVASNLKQQAAEIQRQIETAIAKNDASFFGDFAFFLENPLRKYSRLKAWLVGICFIETGWLESETSTEWMVPKAEKEYKAGEQTQVLSGEQLARLYQAEMGDDIEVSQIYRACRELGIKAKHPKKRPVQRNRTRS